MRLIGRAIMALVRLAVLLAVVAAVVAGSYLLNSGAPPEVERLPDLMMAYGPQALVIAAGLVLVMILVEAVAAARRFAGRRR